MDDADDDLIGDQLAGLHVGFRLLAGGGTVFHGGPEDVASGDGGDIQLFAQDLGLCAFAGAGGAQQNQFHEENLAYSRKPLY